jgi:malate synthase
MNMREVFATAPVPEAPVQSALQPGQTPDVQTDSKTKRSASHGDKKPVLIHIPPDLHRTLKRVALDDDTTITAITERQLRAFLVAKGYTKFADEKAIKNA